MNILMASSELSPLIRSGDLADTLASLTSELRTLGHEVSVVLPYYRAIRENKSIKTRRPGENLGASGQRTLPLRDF